MIKFNHLLKFENKIYIGYTHIPRSTPPSQNLGSFPGSVASFCALPTPQRIMTIGLSQESPHPPSNCESLTNLWTWQSSFQGTDNRYFLQPHVDIESTKKCFIPCRRILPCIVVGGGWSQRPHDILQPRLVVLFLFSDKHGPSLFAQSRF